MGKQKQKSASPRMRTTILKRIVHQSIIVTTLTAIILSLSAYFTTVHLIEKRVFAQLSSLVDAKEELIARRIDADRKRTALFVASASSVDLRNSIEAMQKEGIPALGISVFSRSGYNISQTGVRIEPPKSEVLATTLIPSEGKEGWDGYTIYSPSDNGNVVAIQYSLQEFLAAIFSVPSLGETGEVLLAKQEGEDLILLNHAYAIDQRSPLLLGDISEYLSFGLPIAEAVAKREDVRSDSDYAGNDVYVAFRQIPTLGWGLAVKVHRKEAMSGIVYMAIALAVKSVFLLLIASYFAVILSRRLTAPLRHLTNKMHKLGPNNWSLGRTIKTGDEVEVLERIAAGMAKRLKQVYDHLEEEVEERTEDLKKEYLKSNSILETIDQGVITVNKDGLITDANPAALSALKYQGDACVSRNIEDILDVRLHKKRLSKGKHPVLLALTKRQTVRSTPEMRYSIMNSDNILVPVLLVVKPLLENKKIIGAIAVFHDVTEERRVDYLKSEFISLASHQLRTPLSSLQWYIELLNDEKHLKKDQREYIDEMDIAAKRMSALIDSLLHAARLEGGDITPHAHTVELTTLMADLGAELRSMAKQKKIATSIDVPKQKIYMETDSVLLHVTFKNLFSNAVKYTQSGGQVGVTMKHLAKHVEIIVSDNGIGIPKKDQKRLFQRLFRADNVRKLDTDGNGLGLYISKMIVDSLGGSITAKSTEGKGTMFIVKLPIKKKSVKRKKK